jgi:hypothetical protein
MAITDDDFKIQRIEKISKSVESFKQYVDNQAPHGIPSDRSYFDSLIKQVEPAKGVAASEEIGAVKPTLFDEVAKANGKIDGIQQASTEGLIADAKSASDRMAEVRGDLRTPGLKIGNTPARVLRGKLTGISDSLKVAFAKAGLEYSGPEKLPGTVNPVRQFLDYLANGQSNLDKLGGHVEALAERGDKMLSPADLLTIQIKVSNVQQELEFFANLLNKTLESTKTLMNVQV